MSKSFRLAASVASLALCAALLLPIAPAAADDYDLCLGSTDEAIDACTRVITSSRSTRDQVGNAYIGRGQHYYEKDDYDRAIEDFNHAMPLKPKWLQLAYGNRGNAYAMKGENDRAIDSYSVAISLDKNYSAAFTGRGLFAGPILVPQIGQLTQFFRVRRLVELEVVDSLVPRPGVLA